MLFNCSSNTVTLSSETEISVGYGLSVLLILDWKPEGLH